MEKRPSSMLSDEEKRERRRSLVAFQIFENCTSPRRTSARKKQKVGVQSLVMRALSSQQCSRLTLRRRWMCGGCLTNQGNRYNSSIPVETSEVPEPSKSIPLEQRSPESINVIKNKEDTNADRSHLKNRGQYFVTTPIFYVNGGNSVESH